jgi:hypothetical protein
MYLLSTNRHSPTPPLQRLATGVVSILSIIISPFVHINSSMALPLKEDLFQRTQPVAEDVVKKWVGCYQTLPITTGDKQPIQLLGKLTNITAEKDLNRRALFKVEKACLTDLNKKNINGFVGFTTTANNLTVPLSTSPFGEVLVRCFDTETASQPSSQMIAKTLSDYLEFQEACYNNPNGRTTTMNRRVNIDPSGYFIKPLPNSKKP